MAARIKVTDLPESMQRKFRAEAKQPRNLKYRNCPTFVDGLKFDSKKEAQRYGTLKHLERLGEIRDLRCQVRYPLIVNGVLVCYYVADFTYVPCNSDRTRIEDVKSPITRQQPTYRIKFKLMAALGNKIIEV